MRNLKRALSLALASVMLLGMMVVGTGASYADVTSKNNQEAIEVLQAIGVMSGDDKGNFNPDQKVTRVEMAVVMANLLNLDYNYYVGAKTSFTDVPDWAQSYVSACYANGIIAGYSNTKFGSNDSVTAAQAGLMMMKALGYFRYQNDFESDWQLATVKQASKIDLYDGISAGATAPLTRNDVAQLVLNTLESNMVEFNGTVGTDITTSDGTTITVGYRAQYDPYTSTKGDYTPSDSPVGDGYLQLVEELFGSDLKKYTSATSDDFCRPSNKWTYNNKGVLKDIGSFAVEPTLTYTKAVTEADLYKDLGLSETTGTKTVSSYIDGTGSANNYTLNKGDDTTKIGGNGALTEVFVDDSNNVTIVVTNTYIGEVVSVTKATATADRYITISGNNAAAGTFETEGFDKEDIVLYTYSNKAGDTGVKSVALAQKVTGKLTGYAAGKSVTVDGTTYEYANKKDTVADGSTLKIDVNIYLDQYGYAIDVEGVKADVDYAYVLKYTDQGGIYGSDKIAQLLMADGSIKDVQVKDVANGGTAVANDVLVSYTVDSNDKYTLTGLKAKTAITDDKTLTITKGSSTVTLDSKSSPITATADGKTIFLVITGTSTDPIYTAYNGIANVPSITVTGDGAAKVYADYTKAGDTAAKMIVVDARGAVVNTDATEIVYIVGDTESAKVTDADGSYYVYNAVVDGKITTVKVDATLAEATATKLTDGTNRIYKSVNYNDKGIISSVGIAGNAGTGTDKEANGTIGLNNTYYVYTKDCVVFYIDKDENITTSSIGAIAKDSTDTVKFVTNSDGKVTAIFVEEQTANTATLAISVKVDGTEKATVATGGWDSTGGKDGSTEAKAKTATASNTGIAANKAIVVDATVTNMATVSVISNTVPTSTDSSSNASGNIVYRVVAEDGTVCYYKLTVSLSA